MLNRQYAFSRMNITRYTRSAGALDRLLALPLVDKVPVLSVDLLPDNWLRPVFDTHKSIGVAALGLSLLRVLRRASHRPPPLPLPQAYATWEHKAWKNAPRHPMRWFGLLEWPCISFIMALPAVAKNAWHDVLGAAHKAAGYGLRAEAPVGGPPARTAAHRLVRPRPRPQLMPALPALQPFEEKRLQRCAGSCRPEARPSP